MEIFDDLQNQFDLVVGNPPYVRIHNIEVNLQGFTFCQQGMSDLYIAFYEIGLKLLMPSRFPLCNGKKCFFLTIKIYNRRLEVILNSQFKIF